MLDRPKTWTFSKQGLGAFRTASGNTHHSLWISAQEIGICTQEDNTTTNDPVTVATQAPPSSSLCRRVRLEAAPSPLAGSN